MLYLHDEGGGQSLEAALYYGKQYLAVMIVGLLPFGVEQVYAGTLRECGETVLPMKAGIATLMQCYSLRGLDAVAAMNISNTVTNMFNVLYVAMGNADCTVVFCVPDGRCFKMCHRICADQKRYMVK